MKIKKIQMKDYKRFHNLTIDLGNEPKRIVALVGANGCGKSSIFDAMLYLDYAYNSFRGSKDYRYHSLKQDSNYDYRKVNIQFDVGNFEEVRQKLIEIGKANTIFSFRSAYRYNSNLKIESTVSIPEIELNQEGAMTASDLDNRMEQNYRRIYSKLNQLLRKDKKRYTLALAEDEVIGELNASIKNCLNLRIDSLGDIESNRGTIFFKKDDYNNAFEYNVLSSGEREVVDILLDLYLRKDVYTDSVYIIDEPELHVNTSIQRKLLYEINKIIPSDCQIWLATHSIGFMRCLQEELKEDSQIIEFNEKNKWASKEYILYPIKKSRTKWKELFEIAVDDLTNLIVPKCFVYCEGRDLPNAKGEAIGFDEKVYNTIFEEKYPDTLFVSSGGNTELDQRSSIAFTILSKALKDVKIYILKDRDIGSGKIMDDNQRQVYLESNNSNHRVLKRYELENYLFDKAVLVKYCEEKELDFNEEKYNRCVTDIVNQNLKDSIGMIKSICGIYTSISEEKFKLNLAQFVTEDMEVYKELEECIFY